MNKTRREPEIVAGDDEARKRFFEDFAAQLLRQVRREESAHDEGLERTPQYAAKALIELAVDALSEFPTSPPSINAYLLHALEEILDGKDADVAFGVRATSGNASMDTGVRAAITAHVEMLRRRYSVSNKTSLRKALAQAKKDTLDEILENTGRTYTADWLDRLYKNDKHTVGLMSDEELNVLSDLSEIRGALRQPYRESTKKKV